MPAGFDSINEWALGLTSNFVVGVVAEGIGKRIPTVMMPCVSAAYAQHGPRPVGGDTPVDGCDGSVRRGRIGANQPAKGARKGTRGRWSWRLSSAVRQGLPEAGLQTDESAPCPGP